MATAIDFDFYKFYDRTKTNPYKTAPGWDAFKNQMHTLEEIPEG